MRCIARGFERLLRGLTSQDLAVLNRAARSLQDTRPEKPLLHLELVILRTKYQPGMSANDLLEAAA